VGYSIQSNLFQDLDLIKYLKSVIKLLYLFLIELVRDRLWLISNPFSINLNYFLMIIDQNY
jgi:hypothetical protein